jgi:hypothetical protein
MNSLRGPSWILASITYLALSGIAIAQRAGESAVTAAEDAFGTAIGLQNVGFYSPEDARGFSPQQAGNLRIERLYFDQQTWVTTDCMVRETTMRVALEELLSRTERFEFAGEAPRRVVYPSNGVAAFLLRVN